MFNIYEFEKRVKVDDDTKTQTNHFDKRAKSLKCIYNCILTKYFIVKNDIYAEKYKLRVG